MDVSVVLLRKAVAVCAIVTAFCFPASAKVNIAGIAAATTITVNVLEIKDHWKRLRKVAVKIRHPKRKG